MRAPVTCTLRTPSIDYNGRFCMASAAVAAARAFGLDRGLPFPLADVARTDAILLVGGNPTDRLRQNCRSSHCRTCP